MQFAAIKEHLLANAAIEWVWFDFWSMPQGRHKSEVEDMEFSVMLPNINLLYLFCRVLILLDGSYMSRFWTQFEAFLSFRKVTANGLDSTPEGEQRDTIVCIHNADSEFDPPKLRKMWGDKTAEQAYAILEKPDVKVTNQKDKDVQLPKLEKLNEFAKSAVADIAPAAPPAVDDDDTFQITVPEGVNPGDKLKATTPSGVKVLLRVPEGAGAGTELNFTLPKGSSSSKAALTC